MSDLTLTATEERAVRQALMDLPKVCRYHGSDFEFLGTGVEGAPRCESCRIPWRAQQAWRAYTAAIDRRDDRDQAAARVLSQPANATKALDNVNWTV
jgi:hypothetical protein